MDNVELQFYDFRPLVPFLHLVTFLHNTHSAMNHYRRFINAIKSRFTNAEDRREAWSNVAKINVVELFEQLDFGQIKAKFDKLMAALPPYQQTVLQTAALSSPTLKAARNCIAINAEFESRLHSESTDAERESLMWPHIRKISDAIDGQAIAKEVGEVEKTWQAVFPSLLDDLKAEKVKA